MNKPKVSIVIPVYNGADYMREAIDSALQQTYENCEVLVVNDGSTDNTEEIALSYGEKIRYFSKENGGVSTALNVGIQNMTGEYFCYLPHDDMFYPDKVKIQMEAILESKDEMSIVWSGWNYYHQSTGKRQIVSLPIWHSQEKLRRGVYPLFFSIVNTVTVMVSKKYFDSVGEFDPNLYTSQDYDMWFRIFRRHDTIYIDQQLVDYREHEKQGTQADPQFIDNCMEQAMDMMKKISVEEVCHAFGSEYVFYAELIEHYQIMNWEKCLNYAKKKLANIEEPKGVKAAQKRLADILYKTSEIEKIILYGAGENGRRLLRDLQNRGIEVDAWCDSDTAKQGQVIAGKKCLPLKEIDRQNTMMIVTIDHPEKLKIQLAAKGYSNITDYYEIADVLYQTLPTKARLLEARGE